MPPPAPDHWNAIVAAVAVLLGVAIAQLTQWASVRRERRHRRTAVLLEKLESLMNADREGAKWLASFQACTEFQQATATQPEEHLHKIAAFSLLYFPRLQSVVSEHHQEVRSFYSHALRTLVDGIDGNVGAHLEMMNDPEYKAKVQTMSATRKRLFSAIEREAQSLLSES